MQFLTNTNFDFIGKWRIALAVSTLLILAGLVSLVVKGGPALSIDFRGGQIVEVHCEPAIKVADARAALGAAGVAVDQVVRFGSNEELLVYLQPGSGAEIGEGTKTVTEILAEAFPQSTVELRREENVGPKIGGELRAAAANSIVVAMFLIVAYIWFRFSHFQFSMGAVVALIHDVAVTIGVFSLLDKEIGLVTLAAFLTIIGYSLNDTIIVYDRIRENMAMRRKESYASVVNKSLNETLSRTIITSATTWAVALVLFLVGGPVIHDFAFALVIGVGVGTYSSIYVASPILIWWYNWRTGDRKRGTNPRTPARAAG